MKSVITSLGLIASVAFVATGANAAGTANDGRYYFDKMKEAMVAVLNDNQGKINGGGSKSDKLTADAIYKDTYKTFKKIAGKDFKLKALKGSKDPEKVAQAVTTLLQAGRITIAGRQKGINTEADGSVKLKKFIPAVFGRLTIDKFTELTGVHMKQTTLGKGGYGVRNPYNQPEAWEAAALEKIMSPDWKLNQGFGAVDGGTYQFVKPIYIKKGCLPCHGAPVGEKGPYGHPKEGYKVGEVRGGISIALPVN